MSVALWSFWRFHLEDSQQLSFYRVSSSTAHLIRNLEYQTLKCTTAGDKVSQLYLQAPSSAGTTGVPIAVHTCVGTWGEISLTHDRSYIITFLNVAVLHRHCVVRVKLRKSTVIQNFNLSIKDVKQKYCTRVQPSGLYNQNLGCY